MQTRKLTEVPRADFSKESHFIVEIDEELKRIPSSQVRKLVEDETDRAVAAEKILTDNLSEESRRAVNAENKIAAGLVAETERASVAESEIADNLSEEISRAQSAEVVNAENLTTEANRALASETELQSGIQAETERAEAAEASIRSTINTNKPVWDDKYTRNEVDNKFSTLETSIDWKEAVNTYADLAATYPHPEDGWTVNVKDTDYTYRWSGTGWVAISANAIPKATQELDGLMSKEDKTAYDEAYVKRHGHGNKSVLDKITQTLIDAWGAAYAHISDAVKHITPPEREKWDMTAEKVDEGYLPLAGGTVNGYTVFSKGTGVHYASGTGGKNGYILIAQIKITGDWCDSPNIFELICRSSKYPMIISVSFENVYSLDPNLRSFIYYGTDLGAYIHKSAMGTWNLYIQKHDMYENITVSRLIFNPNCASKMAVDFIDIDVSTLPTGYVTASFDFKASTASMLATKRKIGDALFDGSADITVEQIGAAPVNHTHTADQIDDMPGAPTYTHPDSGVTAGTYRSVTVDNQGHVTAGTNPTTLSGYGITDAVKSTWRTITLTSAGWSGAYPFTQTVTVSGIAANDSIKIIGVSIPANASLTQVKSWNKAAGLLMHNPGGVAANQITFKAYKKPAVDFSIITEGA